MLAGHRVARTLREATLARAPTRERGIDEFAEAPPRVN